MMKQAINSLMKIVPCVKRAEQFLDGQLYCNTIPFLCENFDEYEGSIPLSGILRINDDEVSGSLEPPRLRPHVVSDLNVFCMFAWLSPYVNDEDILFDPEHQLGSIRNLEPVFGEYTVAILNVPEFFRRVDWAVKDSGNGIIRGIHGVVEYVESSKGTKVPTTSSDMMKVVLRKQKSYEDEKEYRFAYLIDREPGQPFILNIGDIRDISTQMKTQDVYDLIKMNGRPLSYY